MALKRLYRSPLEDIPAVVVAQDDGKLTVYLIITNRMSISAEPESLRLHSDRQEWQGRSSHRASCLSPRSHCTHTHTQKKIAISDLQVQLVL